jgi:uncharacterized protein
MMNRLKDETSPYLLQHSKNPVNWMPWGDEAFKIARDKDLPVFLSIGYSTCHWCHVMEKESFEDQEVAGLLNRSFICIKVDREERPDIDKLYMDIAQLMTGSGGWPLSVFMTPGKEPFFAATYIPREDRFGQAGLLTLLPRIDELWKNKKAEIAQSAAAVIEKLSSVNKGTPGDIPDYSLIHNAFTGYAGAFDRQYGGFGSAPKFPGTHNLSFLLHYWKKTGNGKALEMTSNTLDHMRWGGIWDHVGYGFHRYSTDREWIVPHFEKMLYDQAAAALTYLDAFQAAGRQFYRETVKNIFEYVTRDLSSKDGGFYTAEDADSEGSEGRYYLWTKKEIEGSLDRKDAAFFINTFNITGSGNYSDEISGNPTGQNIPYMKNSLKSIAEQNDMDIVSLKEKMGKIIARLYGIRKNRIRPFRDEKILTDWNAFMAAAFARGGRVLGEKAYLDKAAETADFLLHHMTAPDGRLYHSRNRGVSSIDAHLDDYAFMIMALIELYQSTYDYGYIRKALEYNKILERYFWDEKNGGYFFTSSDNKDLIIRKKESYDGAIPSGNSIALLNLLRMGRITMDRALEERAAELMRAFSGTVTQNPTAHGQFLIGIDFMAGDSYEIILVEGSNKDTMAEMLKTLEQDFIPNKVVIVREDRKDTPDFLRNLKPVEGMTTAYICRDYYCRLPVTSTAGMQKILRGG